MNRTQSATLDYVVCPATITGPHASAEYPWMSDNLPCGVQCPVVSEADVMEFRCGRGHRFYAGRDEILRSLL